MKKILFLFVFVLLIATVTSAQKTVDNSLNPLVTGVPSLSIAPDARGGGMGDVGAATTPDVNSQYWNPAKYAFMESGAGLSLSYTPWLRKLVSDMSLSYLAGYYKIGDQQAISASLRYFSLGSVDLTDASGNTLNSINPAEYSIDAAYSRQLSDKWSAAVALRFIYSDLSGGQITDMYPGSAVAADVATYYHSTIQAANGDAIFGFGADISNIGSKISYDKGNTSNFLPTNLRLGVSYQYPMDNYNSISFNVDVNKLLVEPQDTMTTEQYSQISPITSIFKSFSDPNFIKRIQASVGVEYGYNNQFFVRGGYFYESQLSGNRKYFTLGAGFMLNVFRLDVAYLIATSQSNPLDQTLRLSLGFDLAGIKGLMK
ncbi:type IX secretion system outer membrane channel protein PorV [Microbacter margulisiae]|uniref:Putative small secreted protein n=1 Tax=Microbacter margulisiae TaxID=1350067 RepID=A0A7W5H271_9PORP|nr:type IX secretion system outer membrane channel protein PorV [Microbacter margulisiae]MBB3187101.1 putative small secreted protein [Microbacter margulisiae]